LSETTARKKERRTYGVERAVRIEALLEDGGLVLGEPELLAPAGAVRAVLLVAADASGAGALELPVPLVGVFPAGAAGERGGAVGRRGRAHRGAVGGVQVQPRSGGGGGCGGVVQRVRVRPRPSDVGDDGAERGGPGRGGAGGGGGGREAALGGEAQAQAEAEVEAGAAGPGHHRVSVVKRELGAGPVVVDGRGEGHAVVGVVAAAEGVINRRGGRGSEPAASSVSS